MYYDWHYGKAGIDTDYFDRNLCSVDAPTSAVVVKTTTVFKFLSTTNDSERRDETATGFAVDFSTNTQSISTDTKIEGSHFTITKIQPTRGCDISVIQKTTKLSETCVDISYTKLFKRIETERRDDNHTHTKSKIIISVVVIGLLIVIVITTLVFNRVLNNNNNNSNSTEYEEEPVEGEFEEYRAELDERQGVRYKNKYSRAKLEIINL
jgi:hypothetical protein